MTDVLMSRLGLLFFRVIKELEGVSGDLVQSTVPVYFSNVLSKIVATVFDSTTNSFAPIVLHGSFFMHLC